MTDVTDLSSRAADERGVTLVELMVTMLVVAVLMGIAVPTIQSQIQRQQLLGSARQVVDTLRTFRDSAVNEGVPRYVLFLPGTPGRLQPYRFDGTAWAAEGPEIVLGGSVGFAAADVTMPSVSGAPESGASVPADAAYFDTRGRYPEGYTASYTITLRGGLGRTVVLTLYAETGQVVGV